MDPDTWVMLAAPTLAAIAIFDSLLGLSVRLSRASSIASHLLWHATFLAICLVIFVVLFHLSFPDYVPSAIVDYLDVREHYFSKFIAPKLTLYEIPIILFSIIIAVIVAVRNAKSVLLSIIAALLGNIGSIVWMMRDSRATLGA